MAAEIQPTFSRYTHTGEDDEIEAKEKDNFKIDVSDIEADVSVSDDESKAILQKAEKTELTPDEAFKCDVHGDQSPCE